MRVDIEGRVAWARQPFVGLALAALGGILVAESAPHWQTGLTLTLAFAALALFTRRSPVTYLFGAACFFVIHSLQLTESPGVRLARQLGSEKHAISARGIVVSEPRVSARGTASFHFRVSAIEREGNSEAANATILARWRGEVRYGDELQLFGVIQSTEPPRNPGEFDMRAYLKRRDVHNELIARYPESGKILSRDRGNRIMDAALRSRAWMQAALGRGLEQSPELHSLINAMVLGAGDETPDQIEEQFQQTGTLHLFAVSGLNVAIVAQLLWIVLLLLRLPRKWAIAVIIPGLFFYAAVTGLNTSSVRAAIMAAVLLGGFFFERRVLAVNSLAAAAVLILCWDTNQLFSTGFQLSFAVVIAIFLLAEPIYRRVIKWFAPDPFLPESLLSVAQRVWQRAWGAIAVGASVSLGAWLGSLPLILPYFYLVTPIALVANLVVVPLAFAVLALGMTSLLLTPFAPWLAIAFNNANWYVAAAILWSVGLFARAPAGHIYLERPRWPSGAFAEVTVLDLGPGGAVHVRNRGRDWLIDCGSDGNYKRIVRAYLRSRGINRLDGLILTHGDAAHIGAAPTVLRVFRPREIVDTAAPDLSRTHRAFIAQLSELQITPRLCAAPDEMRLSRDVVAGVLFPPRGFKAKTADDQAMVLQLRVRDQHRILLSSDNGRWTEAMLLHREADLRSDILIKGQHHAEQSGSPKFLDRVRPQAIVASSVEFPASERVSDEWAADVAQRGVRLFRQDETGAVTMRFFQNRWEAIPYLGGETFRSVRR